MLLFIVLYLVVAVVDQFLVTAAVNIPIVHLIHFGICHVKRFGVNEDVM